MASYGYGDVHKHSNKRAYKPHHYYLYDLTPNYENELGTFYNSFGFRGKEIQKQKPEHVYRIIFIGGSTTHTTGVKDNTKIFTNLLEQNLNKGLQLIDSKYKEIEVLNAGVPAFNSAENLIRIIFKISEFSPDLVVIQHGLNDVFPRLYRKITSDYANYRKSWYQPKEVDNKLFFGFKRILKKSRLLTFVCFRLGVMNTPVVGDLTTRVGKRQIDRLKYNDSKYFKRNTEYMVVLLEMIGSDVVLVSEPYNDNTTPGRIRAMPEHNALLEEIAGKLPCTFFDLYQSFPKYEPYLLTDGVHVSEKGSYKKYELLRDYLINDFQLFSKLKERSL